MIPRQWLVSCHRRRASAEAHQSVSDPRAMSPHAAMAAATLAVAASAALDPRPPWSGTIRQATDQLVLATTSRASNARNIGVLCVSRQWLGSKASSTYSGFMPPSLGGRSSHLTSCSRKQPSEQTWPPHHRQRPSWPPARGWKFLSLPMLLTQMPPFGARARRVVQRAVPLDVAAAVQRTYDIHHCLEVVLHLRLGVRHGARRARDSSK